MYNCLRVNKELFIANNKKIVGGVKEKVLSMLKDKETPYGIGTKLGISKETVKKFLKENNFPIYTRNDKKKIIYKNFIDFFKKNGSITESRKKYKISYKKAIKLLKENGLSSNSRKEAALNKVLSIAEAQKRLPDQTNKVIGMKDGKYKIITEDGYIYYKYISKIYQGDPRGKSGFVADTNVIKDKLKKISYTLLENSYTKKRESLRAVHDKCGKVRENIFENFYKQDCPYCSNTGTSNGEKNIEKWIRSLGIKTDKFRFKGKTKGKEIDIYIPSLSLGIEYCGLYWHNENSPQPRLRSYHYDKMKQSEEKSIRLITIFEDEWKNRESQVKGFLKSVLGICELKIYARKCTIEKVDTVEAKNFLDKYHIQGKTNFKVAIGLFYNKELLGLITGNNHHRQKRDRSILVLNRLVFKSGVQIVGGASKLLKSLIKYTKSQGYNKIISWSDNRWSQGNVYKKCGFLLEKELGPDYSYVTGGLIDRLSKQSCQKKMLLKKGAIGTMDNTEKELALTLNYYRIWDCGKKRWVIDLK